MGSIDQGKGQAIEWLSQKLVYRIHNIHLYFYRNLSHQSMVTVNVLTYAACFIYNYIKSSVYLKSHFIILYHTHIVLFEETSKISTFM